VPFGTRHRARASRRRLSPFRSLVLAVLAIAISAVSGGFAYFLPAAVTAWNATAQVVHVPSPSPAEILFSPSPSPSPVDTGAFTVLLLGSDDDSKFTSYLTQSMILVRVVPRTKEVTMVSIPRDLYVPLSVGWSGKISAAYSYGGAGAAIATVQSNFQVHIDYYIWVGLLGLIKVIDAVGGIDVVTSNPVLDDYYPSDVYGGSPYEYKRVAVLAGAQHMDGIHAMEYVRSRHGDLQSDIGRSKRQQQVLQAIRLKAKQMAPEDIPTLATAIGGELKTSIGLDRVAQMVPLAATFDDPDSIRQITLGSPYSRGGAPSGSLWPNWGLILPLVHQYFQ
jgi:LCP family protein required for cell wall assembly